MPKKVTLKVFIQNRLESSLKIQVIYVDDFTAPLQRNDLEALLR